MNPETVKRFRLLASTLSVLGLGAIAAGLWFYLSLRASRPQLDGEVRVEGIGSAVAIERDDLGVPTLRGDNRGDVARALGWVHAQDRFFQMDLLRRGAAGELAELFGPRALPRDRMIRRHGFRRVAEQAAGRLTVGERALLEAYAAGVNAGLSALGTRPFEYLILREKPAPWRLEDSLLVSHAMTIDLQDETGRYERTLMTLRDQFGVEGLAFFAPVELPSDAALDGSTAPLAPVPGPTVVDLRNRPNGNARPTSMQLQHVPATSLTTGRGTRFAPPVSRSLDDETVPGSNAFALAGAHTANGAALLANDMHLGHSVPNIWYRASLEWSEPDPGSASPASSPIRRVTGVTLPGVPLMVAGSNGQVAWGFTNAYADTSDLVVVENVPGLMTWYLVPGDAGSAPIEKRSEIIRIKGAKPETAEYLWTIWGPIVGEDERGRSLAHRWVAHDSDATNLGLLGMETAGDVAAGVAVAHRAGMPAQNIMLADRDGAIAWTIAGPLPKRVGYDGRLPVSWRFGDRRWDGYRPAGEIPVITTRPEAFTSAQGAGSGRLWSANQRHVGGEGLAVIGDGGYPRPDRAAQIRDLLAPLERATPADLLTVQLDDRALFLSSWHRLLLTTLTPEVAAGKARREALRTAAEKWEGRASVDAVSYRLVRTFRYAVLNQVFPAIFASCLAAFPEFQWRHLPVEGAVWALLRERPPHLLNPQFSTWDELLIGAIDDVLATLDAEGVALSHATWGESNTVRIRHPFSAAFPWLAGWLNLPATAMPGDNDMPRVQGVGYGASQRHVVSPGHEADGIFHMPGGQSAHPLSPFHRAGHDAWVRGEPTPFLPGETRHTLSLVP